MTLFTGWYTEAVPNNRMVLSLRSGIDQEVGWALDRLLRLCNNDMFLFKSIPGLIDALFEWPEWYAREGYKAFADMDSVFAMPRELERRRRHALESLFVLRNCALHEVNGLELAAHSHTMPLILSALHNLDLNGDENSEFILNTIDMLHSVASSLILPPPSSPPRNSPLGPLLRIASTSSNRPTIISALATTALILSIPQNVAHLSADSPALQASIRYLPLFVDKALVEACLNYLYVHLSSTPMAKTFLLHSDMPSVLKLLVNLLITEQIEETVNFDVSGTVHTTSSGALASRYHDLTQQELDNLLQLNEPDRCYAW